MKNKNIRSIFIILGLALITPRFLFAGGDRDNNEEKTKRLSLSHGKISLTPYRAKQVLELAIRNLENELSLFKRDRQIDKEIANGNTANKPADYRPAKERLAYIKLAKIDIKFRIEKTREIIKNTKESDLSEKRRAELENFLKEALQKISQ